MTESGYTSYTVTGDEIPSGVPNIDSDGMETPNQPFEPIELTETSHIPDLPQPHPVHNETSLGGGSVDATGNGTLRDFLLTGVVEQEDTTHQQPQQGERSQRSAHITSDPRPDSAAEVGSELSFPWVSATRRMSQNVAAVVESTAPVPGQQDGSFRLMYQLTDRLYQIYAIILGRHRRCKQLNRPKVLGLLEQQISSMREGLSMLLTLTNSEKEDLFRRAVFYLKGGYCLQCFELQARFACPVCLGARYCCRQHRQSHRAGHEPECALLCQLVKIKSKDIGDSSVEDFLNYKASVHSFVQGRLRACDQIRAEMITSRPIAPEDQGAESSEMAEMALQALLKYGDPRDILSAPDPRQLLQFERNSLRMRVSQAEAQEFTDRLLLRLQEHPEIAAATEALQKKRAAVKAATSGRPPPTSVNSSIMGGGSRKSQTRSSGGGAGTTTVTVADTQSRLDALDLTVVAETADHVSGLLFRAKQRYDRAVSRIRYLEGRLRGLASEQDQDARKFASQAETELIRIRASAGHMARRSSSKLMPSAIAVSLSSSSDAELLALRERAALIESEVVSLRAAVTAAQAAHREAESELMRVRREEDEMRMAVTSFGGQLDEEMQAIAQLESSLTSTRIEKPELGTSIFGASSASAVPPGGFFFTPGLSQSRSKAAAPPQHEQAARTATRVSLARLRSLRAEVAMYRRALMDMSLPLVRGHLTDYDTANRVYKQFVGPVGAGNMQPTRLVTEPLRLRAAFRRLLSESRRLDRRVASDNFDLLMSFSRLRLTAKRIGASADYFLSFPDEAMRLAETYDWDSPHEPSLHPLERIARIMALELRSWFSRRSVNQALQHRAINRFIFAIREAPLGLRFSALPPVTRLSELHASRIRRVAAGLHADMSAMDATTRSALLECVLQYSVSGDVAALDMPRLLHLPGESNDPLFSSAGDEEHLAPIQIPLVASEKTLGHARGARRSASVAALTSSPARLRASPYHQTMGRRSRSRVGSTSKLPPLGL
eukprot:gnl/Dysnectes_brevis/5795_a8565_531.p1 GENE.gnl/Dysnectes_brevis/5795_a8565_531~~gnl/Dysnectes_brevis/5795_a8565_531.p1  ORF type:complete len:1005 (+),score=207.63 gnl/Dysnectes_brevis/5795_a8565_531:40-3054(+)